MILMMRMKMRMNMMTKSLKIDELDEVFHISFFLSFLFFSFLFFCASFIALMLGMMRCVLVPRHVAYDKGSRHVLSTRCMSWLHECMTVWAIVCNVLLSALHVLIRSFFLFCPFITLS